MYMARIFELQRKSTLALRQRKQALLHQLRLPPDVLRASYVEQFLTCGKPACACHQGPKHGPYYYLGPVPGVTLFEKAAEGRIVPAAPPTAEQV